jgi:hypothetical protein
MKATPINLTPEVAAACEVAASDCEPDGDPMLIAGSCKRTGEHWYRLVWRHGAWQYFTRRRLESDTYRVFYGCVRPGELVAQHDRGGPVSSIWLVTDENPLEPCTFARTGDRTLRITLPDGRVIERPDPRRR